MVQHISEILQESFKNTKSHFNNQEHWQVISRNWVHIVGEKLAGKTRPKFLKDDGTLHMNVVDSSWSHELQFMKRLIISNLNRHLKGSFITDIKFRIGDIGRKHNTRFSKYSFELKGTLEEDQKEWIAQTVSNIADKELRQTFERVMSKYCIRKNSLYDMTS
ncbi:MAG: DUF721 domain-containing protein [Thermodesulfobacteriota bacterium]|nr:DUF721 domain-containing protein [Thermodesulfobacteriota bacterium]